MSWKLFIDDERDPLDVKWGSWQDQALYRDTDWIIARDLPEVTEIILSLGMPEMISFDHDLGYNKATGYDIAKMLVELVMDSCDKYQFSENFQYMVHSKNPVGAQNIKSYLDNFMAHSKC